LSGVRNFIFMTGWLCSVLGLYKLQAMGNKRRQRIIMILQLAFLFLTEVWCIIEMSAPTTHSIIFSALNFLFPVAGFFMIVTGIVILRARRLKGWRRYIPLLAGFWFPQTVAIYIFAQNNLTPLVLSGIYSTIVFSLLGFCVATENRQPAGKPVLYQSRKF